MIHFKSYFDLSRDIAGGLGRLPDVDFVVGVPKSGLVPAVMLASFINVPFYDLDTFLFVHSARSGMRKVRDAGGPADRQRVLVVDDTVNTGAEFRRVRQRLEHLGSQFEFVLCAVYGVEPDAHGDVADLVLADLPQPRVFQWNYRNHILAEHACFDLDGVLCIDPLDEENDDGTRYVEFIGNARPLFIPRKKISAIVTSRLEKYRAETEDWLHRNGVRYGELLMLDLPSAEERRRLRIHATFKAEIYRERDELIFVESNWKQAREIAEKADKPVICTENDAFLYGCDHVKGLAKAGQLFSYESLEQERELRRQVRMMAERLTEIDPGFELRRNGKTVRPRNTWERERIVARATKPSPRNRARPANGSGQRRVLMLNTTFDTRKGAGAAASSGRLRDALEAAGAEVFALSLEDFPGEISAVDQPISKQNLAFWNVYHDGVHSRKLRARINAIDPDVVVLGAIDRGIMSPLDLALIDYPIVWVCRDNWAHTGGCLFKLEPAAVEVRPKIYADYLEALTCTGYTSGCTDCPAIADPRERIKARMQYELKRLVLDYRRDIVFAPISDWLTNMMKAAPLTASHEVQTVTNPIDLDAVRPLDTPRAELRARFGLPREGPLVLVGAHSLGNPRKGVQLLFDELAQRKDLGGVHFVAIGAEQAVEVPEALRSRFHALGFVAEEDAKVALYNAVDATLVPTLQESLSVVASDSLCCGTPVVAFRASGPATYVEHRRNGYLARPFDAADLLDGLKWVLANAGTQPLSQTARQVALDRFDARRNAGDLLALCDLAIARHGDLGDLPAEIRTLESALALLHHDHTFRHMHIRYQKKALHKAQHKAQQKAEQARRATERIAELEADVRALHGSTSWRLTEPMRQVVLWTRRLRTG